MPTAKRRCKRRRGLTLSELHFHDVFFLRTGSLRLDPSPLCVLYSEADAIAFYEQNRVAFDTISQTQFETEVSHQPGERSWLWWKVDAPEPRDDSIPEVEQLERLGVLTDQERFLLKRYSHKAKA